MFLSEEKAWGGDQLAERREAASRRAVVCKEVRCSLEKPGARGLWKSKEVGLVPFLGRPRVGKPALKHRGPQGLQGESAGCHQT